MLSCDIKRALLQQPTLTGAMPPPPFPFPGLPKVRYSPWLYQPCIHPSTLQPGLWYQYARSLVFRCIVSLYLLQFSGDAEQGPSIPCPVTDTASQHWRHGGDNDLRRCLVHTVALHLYIQGRATLDLH